MSLLFLLRKPPGLPLRPLTFCQSVLWTRLDLSDKTSLSSRCRHSTFCNSPDGRKRRVAATTVPAMFQSASPLVKAYSAQSSPAVLTSSSAIDQPPSPDTRQDLTVYRERYIPITRNSLIRYLSEEKDILTEEERKLLPDLVQSLDSLLVKKYQGILEELKVLFDPINPDKDTLKSREWTRKQKLDHEFWLLQKLEAVMAKANFHELPSKKVEQYLRDHETLEKIRVSVDPSRYDVLRFWVLGHNIPNLKPSISDRISRKFPWRSSDKPREYFKRVVVALRLKQDSKLMLKAFKEVPVEGLEMLLPDGNIRMRAIDRTLVVGSVAVAGFGVLTKVVTALVSLQADWALVATLVTGAMGLRFWTTYRNRRNAYLLDVTRMLYFKNIANNQGLLTLLVDRAEDESLKEAMLTYVQLLKQTKDKKGFILRSQPKGSSEQELKSAVEQWLENKTGVKIEFQPREAIDWLQTLGLVTVQDGRFQVVPLEVAARLLPQEVPSVIAARAADADITQGYSKDELLETDETYKSQDVQIRRYGWF